MISCHLNLHGRVPQPLFSHDNTCVMRTYLCGLTIWSSREPVGEAPGGRGTEEGEPGVRVQSNSVNDLEEEVNCTFMKFLAE